MREINQWTGRKKHIGFKLEENKKLNTSKSNTIHGNYWTKSRKAIWEITKEFTRAGISKHKNNTRNC